MSEDNKIIDINGHDNQELSALYQRAEKPEPPAALDETIRAAARKSGNHTLQHLTQWLSGIAATVIVGIMVVQLYPIAVNDLEPAETFGVQERERSRPQAERFSDQTAKQKSDTVHTPQPAREQTIQRAAPAAVAPQRELKKEAAPRASMPVLRSKAMELDTLSDGDTGQDSEVLPETTITPEMELESISVLIEQGKIEQAKKRMTAFRERYPHHEIPDSIINTVQ